MVDNKFFKEIKGNFGFGCMRLPMIGEDVDIEQTKQMVDAFLDAGLNYFDTAHGYINGKSELAIKECLTSRYPRDKYILTNKLTDVYFETTEQIRPLFMSQLEACGVDYFDFYLMHAQSATRFEKAKRLKAYEEAFKLKEEGLVKHVGFSFHDSAEVLDQILTEYPQFEVVQIQFNYLDYEDPNVQSRKCLEVCEKHNKPVIVMEPVKGGNLVNLPVQAKKALEDLNNGSVASYAIRYAASQNQMTMTLSGMSNMEQMNDNLSFMKDFKPLEDKEYDAINKVVEIIKNEKLIPCTGCRYCVTENNCPIGIRIPDLFDLKNKKELSVDFDENQYDELTKDNNKASNCIECGGCETVCPQKLQIRELLKDVAKTFEK